MKLYNMNKTIESQMEMELGGRVDNINIQVVLIVLRVRMFKGVWFWDACRLSACRVVHGGG
jgi:hypothetical protein